MKQLCTKVPLKPAHKNRKLTVLTLSIGFGTMQFVVIFDISSRGAAFKSISAENAKLL